MGKTQYQYEIEGALEVRKRNFDRCPNCGVHSDKIIPGLKLWVCENENCRVSHFDYE